MARLPYLAVFAFAVVHLLLFSICQAVISSRIYRTNDAVVIEVDDVTPSTLANRNYGILPPIPMMYAIHPYTGLLSQPYPNFPFWPYPHLYQQPIISFSDVENVTATTSPHSRQQKIACGVGPDAPPQRKTPDVGIVGGTEAKPNSWPFMVGLRSPLFEGVFCGGSIISTTRILTAAHCVNELSAYDISRMTVSLGMHVQGILPGTSNDAQMTRRVVRVIYHSVFNKKSFHNDVAILTVAPAIVYSKAISPVCLPPFNTAANQFVNQDAAIMGWGDLESGGDQPNVLQQNTVQIIPNADCNAQYGAGTIFRQQFCASAPGKDTCQSDSGGPLVVQLSDASTSWTQVGIVSYGRGCANPDFAGVYASVAFFRNWIDTYMKS